MTIPTLQEAKDYMRVDQDYTFDDVLIQTMIDSAVSWCEKYTGLAFTKRSFTFYSNKEYFDLEYYPLHSVESVQNSEGDDINYYQTSGFYPRIVPSYRGVTVNYTSGFEDNLPPDLKIAVLMFTNTIYENRESFVISNFRTFANELPISVKDLLGLHTRSAGLFL